MKGPKVKRTASSKRWLDRQHKDPYVAAAERRGYKSRAAFKLAEIDDAAHLLRPGAAVVDLGAAPGGWTQVAVERTKPRTTGARVVAADTSPMDPIEGAVVLLLDVSAPDAAMRIRDALGRSADIVLSDMSPATTGHKATDNLRSLDLAETALIVAIDLLAPGGAFLVKLLQGGGEVEYVQSLRRHFESVRRVKPPSSRAESREIYMLAKGFRAEAA
jgi:23S rRNA (uridine2552-2'-O)-methyltransferase